MSKENTERQLAFADFTEPTLLLNISQLYREDMTDTELYEATRGYWKVSRKRAENVKYAMPVYEGKVLDVYEISAWREAGSTPRPIAREGEDLGNRYEFEGKIAPEEIRERYRGSSVSEMIAAPMQNPVRYLAE